MLLICDANSKPNWIFLLKRQPNCVMKGKQMTFADALTQESRHTYTENGATAYNTTGNAILDFFSCVGSLRNTDNTRIERIFADAYAEDPLLATKILFYARDIREGLGERQTFRTLLHYAATHHPEAIAANIELIGFYGRFDDLYELIDTPIEDAMWSYVRKQLEADEKAMENNKPCSLLAKWLKTADASSKKTRALGIYTAKHIGTPVYHYKRRLRALRRYIKVVETQMSANQWNDIDYAGVPSRAMHNYRNAFDRHDHNRFESYLSDVTKGSAKINASTLYPYDLVEKYLDQYYGFGYSNKLTKADKDVIEAQWKALPDYVSGNANAIVIADTSGSMYGRPLCSAVALAIYFAEHNHGPYHNLWMSFSHDSKVQHLKGETLEQKIASMDMENWDFDTNLERAFMHVLDIAIDNHVAPKDMVKSLIVISDMEINYCTGSWSFYDEMRTRFEEAGYKIPNIVFWNVNSRHDIFHTDADRQGVQLCSGQSASTFHHLMNSIGLTPIQMMLNIINSKRYDPITVEPTFH